MSQTPQSAPEAASPPAENKGSPVRLIVLLAILAVVFAGLMADLFYMYDAVEAASKRLTDENDKVAQRPVSKGKTDFLSKDDVKTVIGFGPSATKVEDGKLFEYYRWWGPLPLSRRSIEVIYADESGSKYDGHNIANPMMFGGDDDPAPPFVPAPGTESSGAPSEGSPSPPSDPASDGDSPEPMPESKEPDATEPDGKGSDTKDSDASTDSEPKDSGANESQANAPESDASASDDK
jgi:hypothetical protein